MLGIPWNSKTLPMKHPNILGYSNLFYARYKVGTFVRQSTNTTMAVQPMDSTKSIVLAPAKWCGAAQYFGQKKRWQTTIPE